MCNIIESKLEREEKERNNYMEENSGYLNCVYSVYVDKVDNER